MKHIRFFAPTWPFVFHPSLQGFNKSWINHICLHQDTTPMLMIYWLQTGLIPSTRLATPTRLLYITRHLRKLAVMPFGFARVYIYYKLSGVRLKAKGYKEQAKSFETLGKTLLKSLKSTTTLKNNKNRLKVRWVKQQVGDGAIPGNISLPRKN